MNGELFHILHVKIKNPYRISMRYKRYFTCVLGSEPIGIIMYCNIEGRDYTFNFLSH